MRLDIMEKKLQIVAAIIAILGFLGIATIWDIIPFGNTESEQTKSPSGITHLEADESPFFMTRTVDENDLRDKSKWELDVMRNEIFARYGRRFKRSDLQTYFNGQAWYEPRYAPDEFPLSLLTPIQKRNVDFMLKYQNRKYPTKETKDNVSLQ